MKNKECMLNGKRIACTGAIRMRHARREWGFYNVQTFSVLDDTGKITASGTMPAAQFQKSAHATGRTLVYSADRYHIVQESQS